MKFILLGHGLVVCFHQSVKVEPFLAKINSSLRHELTKKLFDNAEVLRKLVSVNSARHNAVGTKASTENMFCSRKKLVTLCASRKIHFCQCCTLHSAHLFISGLPGRDLRAQSGAHRQHGMRQLVDRTRSQTLVSTGNCARFSSEEKSLLLRAAVHFLTQVNRVIFHDGE